ncbi:MAG: hypothetical protein CENE_02278 [Candidatus Celerinatantimonas neptuna]|nr:MAG: hypothetical protein CENE_02278 [Candidatus Celerinatantimonas neptuna]
MIYKTREFARLTKKELISDKALVDACQEIAAGLVDAHLGGYLYKKRVASQSGGKRGGYRTLLGAVINNRYFFLYAFAKNVRANVTEKEKLALRELAEEFIQFDTSQLEQLIESGELIKIGEVDE